MELVADEALDKGGQSRQYFDYTFLLLNSMCGFWKFQEIQRLCFGFHLYMSIVIRVPQLIQNG